MDDKEKYRERIYMNWALVYACWTALISYALAWALGLPFRDEQGILGALIGIWPQVNTIIAIVFPILLYFALRRVDYTINHMDKYSIAIYMLVALWGINTFAMSLIRWAPALGKLGAIHIVIAFLVAGLYKTKNNRFSRKVPQVN